MTQQLTTSAARIGYSNSDSYFSFMFCCPLTHGKNAMNCELYSLREKLSDLKEKLAFWKALSEMQKKELIENHFDCVLQK